jgi:hypothetical protein
MPTVLSVGRYRFSFFSNEGNEAPHVHVHSGGDQAKFWLEPVGLASNYGFNVRELNQIEDIVEQYQAQLLEVWREYFEK